jgi:hypothetical protein
MLFGIVENVSITPQMLMYRLRRGVVAGASLATGTLELDDRALSRKFVVNELDGGCAMALHYLLEATA